MEKNGKSVNVIEAIEAELSDWSEEEAPQQAVMLGPNDVLFGRGTGISGYAGNKNFRKIVWEYREAYAAAGRNAKQAVAEAVITRIFNLDPPGKFVEDVGNRKYYKVEHTRALEKTQQALREKTYSPPEGFSKKPAAKKARRTTTTTSRSGRAKKKKIEEAAVREPVVVDSEAPKPKASKSKANSYRTRSSSIPQKKQIQVPDEDGPPKATAKKPVSKLKTPPMTPKVKKQAMKTISGSHRQKKKETLPTAKKALFQPIVDEAPPKLRKESPQRDIKMPRPALADSTPTQTGDNTFCRSVSEHSTVVQAKMPPKQGHGSSFAAAAAFACTGANAMAPPGLPPHLSAFIGAVFQPETPPEATKPVRVVDSLAHGSTLCGGDSEDEYGSVMSAPPPPLVAQHSLCAGDHQADMEVIKEFDPVAAWNTFAVQKKDEW